MNILNKPSFTRGLLFGGLILPLISVVLLSFLHWQLPNFSGLSNESVALLVRTCLFSGVSLGLTDKFLG